MSTSEPSQSTPRKPEVHVSGSKLPYTTQWLYRVSVDGSVKDEINSTRKWTTQELIDVQGYYTESLTGYIFSGEHLEGYTSPKSPVIRKPMYQRWRRTARPVED